VENSLYFRRRQALTPLKKLAATGSAYFRILYIYHKAEKEKCPAGSKKDPLAILFSWIMG
jgi:hypothetical protein